MPDLTDAQKKARTERVKRHQKKCDAIMLRPHLEHGQRIRDAAARAGMSVQAWVLDACDAKMMEEGTAMPDSESDSE